MQSQTALLLRLQLIASLSGQDFCPWANRYVYWLKEPVGWFVVALAVSTLVGLFLSPLGWTVAAGLCTVLALGLGFPWLATRTLVCELKPVNTSLHERQPSQLQMTVRNRLPFPIVGLMVEGYLTRPFTDIGQVEIDQSPDVGLARVPALSMAAYRLSICQEYRGRYPVQTPNIACAFPFGIWTARQRITTVIPVLIQPLLIPITAELEFSGCRMAHVGGGDRSTDNGEFLGVRDFRRGDSLKSIHWVQSARNDRIIVCERGGPQQQAVELKLSTMRCEGSVFEVRARPDYDRWRGATVVSRGAHSAPTRLVRVISRTWFVAATQSRCSRNGTSRRRCTCLSSLGL